MKYKRILLKLSGGALSSGTNIFCEESLHHITNEIIKASNAGVEIAVLVGGGNIFRGRTAETWNMERAEADHIGLLATIINSLMIKEALKFNTDKKVSVMTSLPIPSVAEPFIREKALKRLERGTILVLGGGGGQPFVTTDYPSIQRAIELRADVVLMAKQGTNGVYTDNPNVNRFAKRYKTISNSDVIANNLQVADLSAFMLASDFGMPLYVFDFNEADSIFRICSGENVGTYIGKECATELY